MSGYPWATGDALLAADLNAAIVAASSGIAAGGPFLPLSGGTVTGPTNISQALMVGTGMNQTYSGATWTPPFWLNTNIVGSTTATGLTNVHQITINADTVDASGSSIKLINYAGINANMGGATMKGNRQAFNAGLMLSAPSGNTPSGGAYVAVVGTAAASASDHGTGLTWTTAGGGLWGANFFANTTAGCLNWGQVIGVEVNPAIGTGSTATQIIGVLVTPTSAHTVRGALGNDTGYLLSNQAGAIPIDVGYACGSSLATWPIRSDGAIFRAQLSFNSTAMARYGIDLKAVSFPAFGSSSVGAFVSNGFAVDGLGAVQCGTTYLSPSASGLIVDTKGSVGSTLPTIAAGGTGYGFGATLFDPYGGIYTVTGVGGGGAVTSIAALVGPNGETHHPYYPTKTPPANPVPTTTWAYSTGASGCTLNLTWDTSRTVLSLQPSGGPTRTGGDLNVVANATFGGGANSQLNFSPNPGTFFVTSPGNNVAFDCAQITFGWGANPIVRFNSTACFTANGTKAVSLTAIAPAAANATVVEWLTFQDAAGNTHMSRVSDMTPQQPLTVTLEAQQWEQVLRILDETPAPHRITHPLIVGIQQQCMAASVQVPTNGAELTEDARA